MRNAIVVGIHRGLTEVEPLDVKQMSGRAGRVGLDERGDAYILLPSSKFTRYKHWCENIPPISSTFKDTGILAFHIVSEICENEIDDVQSLIKWYNRSLAAFQNHMLDLVEAQQLLDELEKVKIIEKKDSKYKITNLGRVAAHLYFDPFTIAGWYFNFNKIFYDKKEDDTSLSWALANVNKYKDGFVGKDQQDVIQKYKVRLMLRGMMTGDVQCIKGICFESLLENSDLANQKSKTETQSDFDRTISALERIDVQHAHWNKGDFWKKLQIRIQYQVSWEQTELCSLNHIGGARVRDLFIAGIQTLEQFKADHIRTAKVLGNTIYNKVVTENDLRMPLINEEKQTDWKKVSKIK